MVYAHMGNAIVMRVSKVKHAPCLFARATVQGVECAPNLGCANVMTLSGQEVIVKNPYVEPVVTLKEVYAILTKRALV